ncbi:RNA dependent RNA polymerase-domain-containing protein [Mycena floridula]|nr:RNA dependent RNA polymerase-domain-containing protein [Mycena floridula]
MPSSKFEELERPRSKASRPYYGSSLDPIDLDKEEDDLEDNDLSFCSDPTFWQEYFDDSDIVLNSEPMDILNSSNHPSSPLQSSSKRKATDDTLFPSKRQAIDPDEPIVIAHCSPLHKVFEVLGIQSGVKFEIARLASLGRLVPDELVGTGRLNTLKGCNADSAPKAAATLLKVAISRSDPAFAQESAATSPWRELDKEEDILAQNPLGGIGNNPEYPGYYGGKIHFRGTVKQHDAKSGGKYWIELEHAMLGPSCKVARRFGSTSFLRIKIPTNMLFRSDTKLRQFLLRPLVILTDIYRAFYAKDSIVFFWKTDESLVNGELRSSTFERKSLFQFLEFCNPLGLNSDQKLCKWAARMQLVLSTSVPGPQLEIKNVTRVEDIVSSKGSDMTDGCGFSNLNLHLFVRHSLQLQSVPTAIQFRTFGAKGMTSLHLDDTSAPDILKMWIRSSQIKIHYPKDQTDPSHLTMDILRFSKFTSPSRLSHELIINLHHNGVPTEVFLNIQKKATEDAVMPLLEWEGQDALVKLWRAVEEAENVLSARKAREAPSEARINGSKDEKDDDDDVLGDDDFDTALSQRSSAWWADTISGCPSSLAETAMSLLDSGFDPNTCSILRTKLKAIAKSKARRTGRLAHFDIPLSVTAFVIPDHYGVLGPDEIQIKSSTNNLLRSDGLESNVILGDVLLTRSPCKLPTDVRKVKAVEHPMLADMVDVIVCNIKGARRLLDFLGGGDYDGDKCVAMWAPELTSTFVNANEKHSIEPPGLERCFDIDKRTVRDFLSDTNGKSSAMKARELQPYLIGSLRDPSIIGIYNKYHANAVYSLGYDHPSSTFNAAKFCKVLDAPKTGHTILASVRLADDKAFGQSKGPEWLAALKDTKDKLETGNQLFQKRNLPTPFIMDILNDSGKAVADIWQKKVEDKCDVKSPPDSQLLEPYRLFEQKATFSNPAKHDLDIIVFHVERVKKLYGKTNNGQDFTKKKIQERQDALRALSREFHDSPQLDELQYINDDQQLATVRASVAYHLGTPRFAFSVAFRDLCTIKARATGNYKTVSNGFYQLFRLFCCLSIEEPYLERKETTGEWENATQ